MPDFCEKMPKKCPNFVKISLQNARILCKIRGRKSEKGKKSGIGQDRARKCKKG